MKGIAVKESTLDLAELVTILRRNVLGIFVSMLLAVEVSVVLLMYLPKKYKSEAVLDIQSSYFRNPLVSDLVSETTEPTELKAQREALLRASLNEQFVDALGEQYRVFKSARDTDRRRIEREELAKRLQFFALGPTSFQISTTAREPGRAFGMTQAVLERMVNTVAGARYQVLVQARDAIRAQVQFLGKVLEDTGRGREAQQLKQRLADLDANIAALRGKFTPFHPALEKLQSEAGALRSRLKSVPPPEAPLPQDDLSQAFSYSKSNQPIQDIYHDLLRKLSHLNIVLTMEKSRDKPMHLTIVKDATYPVRPTFPNPKDFLVFGIAAGLALALVQTVYYELKRRETVLPDQFIASLGTLQLGTMPVLPGGDSLLKLAAPQTVAALPEKTGQGRA